MTDGIEVLPKYELTSLTRVSEGVKLHRIRALRDFGEIKAGDLGGWIEHEGNLSHGGECWVADEAVVLNDAWVEGGAYVGDSARVSGMARIDGVARVFGAAKVRHSSHVGGYARVYGHARLEDDSEVLAHAQVYGAATVSGMARMCGKCRLYGEAIIAKGTWLASPTYIQGSSWSVNVVDDELVRVGKIIQTWDRWQSWYTGKVRRGATEVIDYEYIGYFNLLCKLYDRKQFMVTFDEERNYV